MQRLRNLGKICLMGLILLASGCGGIPEFPQWSPYIILNSQNKKIRCFLADQKKMIFECEQASTPLDNSLEGYFCTSPSEQTEIIRWAQRVKNKYQRDCVK